MTPDCECVNPVYGYKGYCTECGGPIRRTGIGDRAGPAMTETPEMLERMLALRSKEYFEALERIEVLERELLEEKTKNQTMKSEIRRSEADVWQPIDTAPKNHGEEILVCEADRTMAVVTWLGKENVMYGEEEGFVSGWYVSDGKNDPIWYRGWPYVTHWMALPPAPKEKTQSNSGSIEEG